MVHVRYRGGYAFTHNDHGPLDEGDVVEIGDYTYEQFSYMFVRIDDDTDHTDDDTRESSAPDSDTDSDADATDDVRALDPSTYTVGELAEALSAATLTPDELASILAAEESGKDRSTAKETIRDAMADIDA